MQDHEEEEEQENTYARKKGFTRSMRYLKPRVKELKLQPNLSDDDSFYVNEWRFEFTDKNGRLSVMNSPEENVQVLLKRLEYVRSYLDESFVNVSCPLIGKTVNLPIRFDRYRTKMKKTGQMIVLVVLMTIKDKDIPKEFVESWLVNKDIFGLLYENLLTKAATDEGMDIQENGDEKGGRASATSDKDVLLYCLFSCSSD